MSKTLDLNAMTARIRQNLIWQTVIAAEKAAIVVSSRKNSKRITVADADPLADLDNQDGGGYIERLADVGLSIDEDSIRHALDPYFTLGGRTPQSFTKQAEAIVASFKDDPLLKTVNFDEIKAEIYDLCARRTALSKNRFQLRNKKYLSALGFMDALMLFQETVSQMNSYNNILDDLRHKFGVKFNETNSLQSDLAYQQANAVLKEEQKALASVYAYLKTGKLYTLDLEAHRAVEAFFKQSYSPEAVQNMQKSRNSIATELQRRHVQSTNLVIDTLPLNIEKAQRQLNDAIQLSNTSTFASNYSVVQQADKLEADYDKLKQRAFELAKPTDGMGKPLGDADLNDWWATLNDSLNSKTKESREAFRRLDPEVQQVFMDAADIEEELDRLEDTDTETEGDESTVESEEDQQRANRMEQYTQDLKSYLVNHFNISPEDATDYLNSSKTDRVDLVDFLKNRQLTVIENPVDVFDGEGWNRIIDTSDLQDALTNLDQLLQYSGSTKDFLKSEENRNALIDAQIETINKAKAAMAVLEFKNLFSRLSLTDDEARTFKFISAAVAAKRDSSEALRQAQEMKAPEVNMVLDGLPSVDNIPQDVLVKAFENNSFDLMKPYEAELNNLTYQPLRHDIKDFDLYTATPIDHLQNQLIDVEKRRGNLFRNQINLMKARIHDINNNLKGVDGLSINNRRHKVAQLNTLRLHLDRQLELLRSVMLTPEELPIPDPNQTDPNVIFVQGLKKLVEIRPVVVSGEKTFEVTLRDYIKDTGPVEHKVGDFEDDDDDGIPLFVSQDKFVDMQTPAPTKLSTQVEMVTVQRNANLASLSGFLAEAAVDDVEFVPSNRNNSFTRSSAVQNVRSAVVSGKLNEITNITVKLLYNTKDEVSDAEISWFDPKVDLGQAMTRIQEAVNRNNGTLTQENDLRVALVTSMIGLLEPKYQYNITIGRLDSRQAYDDYIGRCGVLADACLQRVPSFLLNMDLAPDQASADAHAITIHTGTVDELYKVRQVALQVFPANEKLQEVIGVATVSAQKSFEDDLLKAFRKNIDANLGELRQAAQASEAEVFNERLDAVLRNTARVSMLDSFIEHADADDAGVAKRDTLIDGLTGNDEPDADEADNSAEPEQTEQVETTTPEKVEPPVSEPVPENKPAPEAPSAINPPAMQAVDASGAPLVIGDKVSIAGGLQSGRVTKITDSLIELETDLPNGKATQKIPLSEVNIYNLKKTESVLKSAEPEPKVERLDVDPCFLNVDLAPIFEKYNIDYRKYVHVDFSLPANDKLRNRLILEVSTLISANPDDKLLRKIMLGLPLKRSIGNLSPALLDKLVALGYSKHMVNNWSEEIARKVLLKKSSPFLKHAKPEEVDRLKELGWSDDDIANFSTLDAYQRIGQRMAKPRNLKTEDVASKVLALESKLNVTPSIINPNTAPQATVVSVKDALQQQLTQVDVELEQTKALDNQEINQLLVAIRDLKSRADESDAIVAAASGNVNSRIAKEPGLTEQENARVLILDSVIKNLQRSADTLSTVIKQTGDKHHAQYLNETRVNIEVYRQQKSNLEAKAKRYREEQATKEFLAQPKPAGFNISPVSYGLKTVHDFDDNTTTDFSGSSDHPQDLDSLNIVPMHKAPEVVERTTPTGNPPVGPHMVVVPKKHVKQVVKPAKTKNHRPPSNHPKGHRKSNLRVKNLMKLTDFFKANS